MQQDHKNRLVRRQPKVSLRKREPVLMPLRKTRVVLSVDNELLAWFKAKDLAISNVCVRRLKLTKRGMKPPNPSVETGASIRSGIL